jgi:ketosteroid isomerase-like protein
MKSRVWIAVLVAFFALQGVAQFSTDEETVWKLEHSYWAYVKAQDLPSYRALWHPDFVGWPSVSPKPVRKDHITDWMTSNTAKGLHFAFYSLKPADSHTTGQLVVAYYWVTFAWQDKNGSGEPHSLRVTHTWIKTDRGWQIIGGMSSPEPAPSN